MKSYFIFISLVTALFVGFIFKESEAGNAKIILDDNEGKSSFEVQNANKENQFSVNSEGNTIRKITRAQGYNQVDLTNNGSLTTRVLTFNKKKDDTGIRVTYLDVAKLVGGLYNGDLFNGVPQVLGGRGIDYKWEIRFNGNSCTNPGPLTSHAYATAYNVEVIKTNWPIVIIGTCFGLPAGTYTIQVYNVRLNWVTDLLYEPEVETGISDTHWSLEAEEVW